MLGNNILYCIDKFKLCPAEIRAGFIVRRKYLSVWATFRVDGENLLAWVGLNTSWIVKGPQGRFSR